MKNIINSKVNSRWEDSATVAVDTDWFSEDIGIGEQAKRATVNFGSFIPVKHTIQIMCPTETIVNLQVKKDSITKVFNLNGGTALTANAAYQFDLVLHDGMTYNIQHKTGTQNVACVITESFNSDI